MNLVYCYKSLVLCKYQAKTMVSKNVFEFCLLFTTSLTSLTSLLARRYVIFRNPTNSMLDVWVLYERFVRLQV